jgi:hypothetical protein
MQNKNHQEAKSTGQLSIHQALVLYQPPALQALQKFHLKNLVPDKHTPEQVSTTEEAKSLLGRRYHEGTRLPAIRG